MPVLQSYQSSYQKTDLPHENFTSVSKIAFSGGNIFKKIFCWNFLSFRGLLYVLGHFKQKIFFFQKNFSPIYLVYLWIYLQAKASPGLGLQSKDWKKRLRLGPSVPTGLAQDRGPDSVFRKGLSTIVSYFS